jgi:hypothetical protein
MPDALCGGKAQDGATRTDIRRDIAAPELPR